MGKRWSGEELNLLKENMDAALSRLQNLLPDRSADEILERIKLLYRANPINKYTEEELDTIRKNPKMSVFNLMKLLPNRSYDSIRSKVYTIFGYRRENPPKRWTTEETDKLKEMVKDGFTNYEIAETLGRPLNSIMGYLYTRGLGNSMKRRIFNNRMIWNGDLTDKLLECQKSGKTLEEIVTILNISHNKIFQKLIHLGYRSMDIVTESGLNRKTVSKLREEIKEKNKIIAELQKGK